MILVVEDEPYIASFTEFICGEMGIETDVCSDGNVALALASSTRYRLIVLDLHVEGVSGLDLISAIRALPDPFGQVKILVASGESTRAIRKAMVAGADGYIEKPHAAEPLRQRINEMIAPIAPTEDA